MINRLAPILNDEKCLTDSCFSYGSLFRTNCILCKHVCIYFVSQKRVRPIRFSRCSSFQALSHHQILGSPSVRTLFLLTPTFIYFFITQHLNVFFFKQNRHHFQPIKHHQRQFVCKRCPYKIPVHKSAAYELMSRSRLPSPEWRCAGHWLPWNNAYRWIQYDDWPLKKSRDLPRLLIRGVNLHAGGCLFYWPEVVNSSGVMSRNEGRKFFYSHSSLENIFWCVDLVIISVVKLPWTGYLIATRLLWETFSPPKKHTTNRKLETGYIY